MKIHNLSIENTKRVKAVALEPARDGLTVIGGRNGQGKTSVLDAIAFALGGDRYRPTTLKRDGSMAPPYIRITMDNGLVVERKGKNASLTVTDPSGRKAGQQLLNEFVGELALNLPKFMEASDKQKADILLKLIGVGDELAKIELAETRAYNERLALGRLADQKAAYVKELPYYPDAPKEPVSAAELIRRQQDILARNGEHARLRLRRDQLMAERYRLGQQLKDLTEKYDEICESCRIAEADAEDLVDETTEEIERDIEQIDEINRKVRMNIDHDRAEQDAVEAKQQYNALTARIEKMREDKRALLEGAQLPLEGLSVDGGALLYHGKKWDCMSGAEQLRVATAIVRALNPKCGFVLIDKLEQMDMETLKAFGKWLEDEGLQAIATRVSTGSECQIIIEDGYSYGETLMDATEVQAQPVQAAPLKDWRNGGGFKV